MTKYAPRVAFAVLVLMTVFALGISAAPKKHTTIVRRVHSARQALQIYVRNAAPQYISNREIRNDIPAWEHAANRDFAQYWTSPPVRIHLLRNGQAAPRHSIVALFVNNGPVQGALAYHTTQYGTPKIVVYAGVGDFFGYSNSVSFTHELFELLADSSISITNQGWPYPDFCLGLTDCRAQDPGTVWYNETADPVEALSYNMPGANGRPVKISDFITPAWFNDHVGMIYDWMRHVVQPFEILPGGYAQFWNGQTWTAVVYFRHAGRDAAGFYKGEKLGRKSAT